MSDTPESPSPFGAFSPAAGFDMLEKMWRMMQIPGLGGTPSPSSMMSDMMAPMASVEELDKRITDMRAVEQWLKLNLNLLQSAIQALEVQRATLATLKAFGAFAQSSLEQAAAGGADLRQAFGPAAEFAKAAMAPQAASGAPSSRSTGTSEAAASEARGKTDNRTDDKAGIKTDNPAEKDGDRPQPATHAVDPMAAIDPTPWWNLLQNQFNQIAAMALAAQPVPQPAASTAKTKQPQPKARSQATKTAQAAVKPASQPAVDTKAKTAAKKSPGKQSASGKSSGKNAGRTISKEAAAGHADRHSSAVSTQGKTRGLGPAASAEGTPSLGPDWPARES